MTAPLFRDRGEAPRRIWVWQPRTFSLDAATGQRGTIVRAAAGAASWDSYGVTQSVVRDRPCWSFAGGGAVPGLEVNTSTYLHWGDWTLPPINLCGLIEFNERGPTSSGGILHIGPDSVAGQSRLSIYYSPNSYRILISNGSNDVASVATVQPSLGQTVRLRWRFRLAGGQHFVQLWQSINGGPEVAAAESAGLAALSSFGTAPKLRVNSIGTSNASAVVYTGGGVIERDDQPLSRLLEALAP